MYIIYICDDRMYQIVNQTVIFNWDFNQVLNDTILNDITLCDKIIFNNYDDLNTCLMTNNEKNMDMVINGRVLNLINVWTIYHYLSLI